VYKYSTHYPIDMTDIEHVNFLDYQPLTYHDEDIHHDFDQWSGAVFLESQAAAPIHTNYLDDIEHIYTGLHKCVDQVVAKISVRTPPRLDQIREQNRKLIDKLTTLECAITGDATAVVIGSGSPVCPPASASDLNRVRSGGKRKRVSQSVHSGTASPSVPNTPSVSPLPCQKCVHIASYPRPMYSRSRRRLHLEVMASRTNHFVT
jgi:hypothetical protein